jgi:hypothetical protein
MSAIHSKLQARSYFPSMLYAMVYLFGTSKLNINELLNLIIQIGILLNGRIYKIMLEQRRDTAIDQVKILLFTFLVK